MNAKVVEAYDLRKLGRRDKDQVKPETRKQLNPRDSTLSHADNLLYTPSIICLILLHCYFRVL